MAVQYGQRLNLDLFQLQKTPNGLEVLDGISVNAADDGNLYVNPQSERGNQTPPRPAGTENFVLGINTSLIASIANGRLHHASLGVEDNDPHFNLREPLGSEQLAPLALVPLGRAALVGLTERDDLTLTKVHASWYEQTRVLSGDGETVPYAAKLILLGHTGYLDIAHGTGRSMLVTRVRYKDFWPDEASKLYMEELGSDQDQEGYDDDSPPGGSHDREPRPPVAPVGTSSAEVEPPMDFEPLSDVRGIPLSH